MRSSPDEDILSMQRQAIIRVDGTCTRAVDRALAGLWYDAKAVLSLDPIRAYRRKEHSARLDAALRSKKSLPGDTLFEIICKSKLPRPSAHAGRFSSMVASNGLQARMHKPSKMPRQFVSRHLFNRASHWQRRLPCDDLHRERRHHVDAAA